MYNNNENLNQLAIEYLEINQEIERLNARKEAIKNSFITEMDKNNNFVIMGNGWKASWIETKTEKFDSKKFKAMYTDLYEKFKTIASGTRFTLNRIKT